mgnify:FL=1
MLKIEITVKEVVNCFQITTLVEDSQENMYRSKIELRCELLSDYYFSRRFTGFLSPGRYPGKL